MFQKWTVILPTGMYIPSNNIYLYSLKLRKVVFILNYESYGIYGENFQIPLDVRNKDTFTYHM